MGCVISLESKVLAGDAEEVALDVDLLSGRDGESHHRALPVLGFSQPGSGGAVHRELAGPRVDPQFSARLPHIGDGHPEADAPGGDASA